METIKEMELRHWKEIHNLQTTCTHEKVSDWQMEFWPPVGYYNSDEHLGRALSGGTQYDIRRCLQCGKIISRCDRDQQREIEAALHAGEGI